MLRQHLQLPSGADAHEPLIPIEAAVVYLEQGASLCRSTELHSVDAGVRLLFDGLHVLASHGHQEALITLVHSAIWAADAVKELSESQSEAVRLVARTSEEWPSTILPHSDWKGEIESMIKATELGKDSRFAGRMRVKRSGTFGQPHRHIVPVQCERLVDIVDAVQAWLDRLGMPVLTKSTGPANLARRRKWARVKRELQSSSRAWLLKAGKLPELEPSTARQWFEVGWEGWKHLTRHPHEMPAELSGAGLFEERRKSHNGQTSPGKRRGNIRSGLKKRHLEVFMKLFGR